MHHVEELKGRHQLPQSIFVGMDPTVLVPWLSACVDCKTFRACCHQIRTQRRYVRQVRKSLFIIMFIDASMPGCRQRPQTFDLVYSDMRIHPSLFPMPHASRLYDHLQLSGVAQGVLDDLIARDQDVLALVVVLLLREVYPAVLDDPTGLAREAYNAAF